MLFALFLIFSEALRLLSGIIAIRDILNEMAISRQCSLAGTIHLAGWISLFASHTIWPIL